LGGHAQFNSLHLRAESDWLRHTSAGDDATPPGRDGDSDQLAWLHARAAEEVRGAVNSISEAHRSSRSSLFGLPLFVASGIPCDHAVLSPLRQLGLRIQCLPETDGSDGSYRKAAVEQAVAEAASLFIGRIGSSYSWTIATRRALSNRTLGYNNAETAEGEAGRRYGGGGGRWYIADPPTKRDLGAWGGFEAWERRFGFPPPDALRFASARNRNGGLPL
jgi:hypothetical protein